MFYDCAAPIIPWHNTYFCRSQTYFSLLQQLPPIWSSFARVVQQTRTSTLKYYKKASESWGFSQQYWQWCTAYSSSLTSRTDLWRAESGWSQKLNTPQHWLQQGSENKSLNYTLRHQLLKPDYVEKGLASFIKLNLFLKIHNMVVIHKTIQLPEKLQCCMKNTKFL